MTNLKKNRKKMNMTETLRTAIEKPKTTEYDNGLKRGLQIKNGYTGTI